MLTGSFWGGGGWEEVGESCRRRLPRRVTVKFVSAEGGASWERSVCHRPEPLYVSQHAVVKCPPSSVVAPHASSSCMHLAFGGAKLLQYLPSRMVLESLSSNNGLLTFILNIPGCFPLSGHDPS